ncbi:hypothetical protein [Eubacterium aggregans]|uniref:hypothetical protein n=1 Tax=Eubacterium aggregans TaxID=81409 RepID=UPI003F3301F6
MFLAKSLSLKYRPTIGQALFPTLNFKPFGVNSATLLKWVATVPKGIGIKKTIRQIIAEQRCRNLKEGPQKKE